MSDELEIPDETLDLLVYAAGSSHSHDVLEPTEEELVQYVLGDLDDSRSRELQRAMLTSASLRSRAADVAQFVERLLDPETSKRFDELRAPDVPDYREFIDPGTPGTDRLVDRDSDGGSH